MAQKNRDKEYWLIPKRSNLHQSVFLINGIISNNYDGRRWNASMQDRLGSFLAKNGSTNDGRTITPQSIRTLIASIPQYLGFLYIDNTTTPNTIKVTEAGRAIYEESFNFIGTYDYNNLREAERDDAVLNYSQIYLEQFLKLQVTNPIILKDCEDIFNFPLFYVLSLLKHLEYLTNEELAMFVFKSKSLDDLEFKILEIKNFRSLDFYNQLRLVDAFKNTHLGNISLVKAPSTSYFQNFCLYTGLIIKEEIVLCNSDSSERRKVNSIIICPNKEATVNQILEEWDNESYDFSDNLELWIDYIGNPNIRKTPRDIKILNDSNESKLIIINKNGRFYDGDLLGVGDVFIVPYLDSYSYSIKVVNKFNGSLENSIEINSYQEEYVINTTGLCDRSSDFYTGDIVTEIINHIDSPNFCTQYSGYLNLLGRFTQKDYINNKSLRGARLEFLFFKLFEDLKSNDIIDEVVWGGKIGQYGLPTQTPGGPRGNPDMILFVGNNLYVFEFTTIKPKSSQWTAEGASVPDHIKNIIEEYGNRYKINGIYLAPLQHERVKNGILSNLLDFNVNMKFSTIQNFIEDLSSVNNREDFIKSINSL